MYIYVHLSEGMFLLGFPVPLVSMMTNVRIAVVSKNTRQHEKQNHYNTHDGERNSHCIDQSQNNHLSRLVNTHCHGSITYIHTHCYYSLSNMTISLHNLRMIICNYWGRVTTSLTVYLQLSTLRN